MRYYATPHAVPQRTQAQPDPAANQPLADGVRLTEWQPQDRSSTDISRALTPAGLDAIFQRANGGTPEDQARLAAEILEKDWDTRHAVSTRTAAVAGTECEWRAPKGFEKDGTAKRIAEELNRVWSGFDAHGLRLHLASHLLPGYALGNIVWERSGKGVREVAPVEAAMVTFNQSQAPLLVSSDGGGFGTPLVPNHFIYHRAQALSGDATRGGLIRPLGWMYCFAIHGVKGLLRFVEKFGMPFALANVDEAAWKADRNKIKYLIQNFGPDGGGVFTKGVEVKLLEGATSGGEVYFRMMDYFGDAKTKVILGQTASSGDSAGLSGGDAQSQVRRDLLKSDCRAEAATLRRDLATTWVGFNYGPDVPVPELAHDLEEEADAKADAEVLGLISQAGYRVEEEEVEAKFGYKLVRGWTAPKADSFLATEAGAERRAADELAAANAQVVTGAVAALTQDPEALRRWVGPIQDALAEATAEGLTADEVRKRLTQLLADLPGLLKQMDTTQLADVLARASFAADANGRLAAAGRVARKTQPRRP